MKTTTKPLKFETRSIVDGRIRIIENWKWRIENIQFIIATEPLSLLYPPYIQSFNHWNPSPWFQGYCNFTAFGVKYSVPHIHFWRVKNNKRIMKTLTTTIALLITFVFTTIAQPSNHIEVVTTQESGSTYISWTTQTEVNTSFFIVERTIDG